MGLGTGRSLDMTRRTALYRLYDAKDVLLYVGIGFDPAMRYMSHKATKPWWPEVARREVVWHETRREAERAEQVAIRSEKPLHNIAGVPGRFPEPAPSPPPVLDDPALNARLAAAGRKYRRFVSAEHELDKTIREAARAGYLPKDICRLIGHAINVQKIGQRTSEIRRARLQKSDAPADS